MIKTQVLLTTDIYNTLNNLSLIKGKSISAILREILQKILPKQKISTAQILKQSVNKIKFSDKHIPHDLSTNDEYLYGKETHYSTR